MPPALAWRIRRLRRWRSNFSIQRHAGFNRHQRLLRRDVARERLVELARFGFQQAGFNLHAGAAQFSKAESGYRRIRDPHGSHYTLYSRSDHRIRTRPGAALMTARFKIQIECCAARLPASLFHGQNFSMLHAFVRMKSSSRDLPEANNHSSHARIWRCQRSPLAGKINRLSHVLLVLCAEVHAPAKQRIDKIFRAEGQQVANLFAHANITHRQSKLA